MSIFVTPKYGSEKYLNKKYNSKQEIYLFPRGFNSTSY